MRYNSKNTDTTIRPLQTILTSMMCIKWVGTATAMHSYDHSRPHCLSDVCGGPWTIAVPLTLELLYIICLAIIWAYHLSRYIIYIHAYWCYIPPPQKATETSLKKHKKKMNGHIGMESPKTKKVGTNNTTVPLRTPIPISVDFVPSQCHAAPPAHIMLHLDECFSPWLSYRRLGLISAPLK